MKREFDRYVVIKNTHAAQALTDDERKELYRLGIKCANWRINNGKKPFECVVVEKDWPEYERVWKMIEARVDGHVEENYEQLKRKAELFDMLRDLMGYVENGTSESITIYQDDATMNFTVSNRQWWDFGSSFEKAIKTAYEKHGGE